MRRIRLLLADDHALIRAGITALLERMEYVEVVGQAEDGGRTINLIRELGPDIVLLDLQMPGSSGFDVLQEATQKFPHVKIVVLSVHDTKDYALRALRSGAAGYLPKSAASAELEIAINRVVAGEQYISPAIAELAALDSDSFVPEDREAALELTPRQREILILIAEGRSTKDIAHILDISVKTVETHRAQLMARLKIHDVASLVRFAVRAGILRLDA